jgi:hypothetical protein
METTVVATMRRRETNAEPTPAAQEEFYNLFYAHAEAILDTAELRTVYLVGDEPFPGGELCEHLIVVHEESNREEDLGDSCLEFPLMTPVEFLADPSARHAHNRRALAIAKLLTAQLKLDWFSSRPENRDRSFRVFRPELVERAIRSDVEPLKLGGADEWQ